MHELDLNEHERDRGALAASIDRTTAYVEDLRSEQTEQMQQEIERTLDTSTSQLVLTNYGLTPEEKRRLDEAMNDITEGGDDDLAQYSNDRA